MTFEQCMRAILHHSSDELEAIHNVAGHHSAMGVAVRMVLLERIRADAVVDRRYVDLEYVHKALTPDAEVLSRIYKRPKEERQ